MKLILTVLGALAALIGGVWILQGIGVLGGSTMSGQIQWAVYGAIVVVVGIGVIVRARRRPR